MGPYGMRPFPPIEMHRDCDLVSGVYGVFASNWIDAKHPPRHTGNYLVMVRSVEPVIALYIKGSGWNLESTEHIGLEDLIEHWMDLPKGPK